MRIRAQCRECGLPFNATITPQTSEFPCPGCGTLFSVSAEGWSDKPPRRVDVCPLCDCRHLYRQRDFNRGLGCLLVAIGAALVPWTYGLSLIALSVVDAVLYYRLPQAVVCYRCDTVYRDARPGPRQKEVDLLKHDVLKYGKSWSELEEDDDAPAAETS